MAQLPVVQTRVFAMSPEGGNPCPIVFDADRLSNDQMQSIAARFGLETAFVLTPSRPDVDLRLRYFVPRHEMEMCVHATVGVVTVLVQRRGLRKSPLVIGTPLGPIPVEWERDGEGLAVTVEQFAPTFSGQQPTVEAAAAALGIPETAVDLAIGPLQSVSTSRSKLLVPLNGWAALDAVRPDFEALWSLCDELHTTGVYPFTRCPRRADLDVEARQFPKRAGYDEDPATGVAASALGAYLARYEVFGRRQPGWHSYRVGQAFAMRRPSVLRAEVFIEGDRVTRCRIAGRATITSEAVVNVAS